MRTTGPLEQTVLEVLWVRGASTVREVLDQIGSSHAYTTILTVLDRLHDKGLVRRRKRERAWVYRAARPREVELGEAIREIVAAPGVDREPLLMAFLETAESVDPDLLDKLERMIRRRKEEKA